MPRPCHQKHQNPEDFAKANTTWSNTQCAVCWSYLNNPGSKKQYDNMATPPVNKESPIVEKPCCDGNKSMATTAVQAAKAFGHWAGQNFRKPTEEQLAERESICRSNVCKKWDSGNDSCLECGCWLKKILPVVGDVGKRNHATQECPLKLWPAV